MSEEGQGMKSRKPDTIKERKSALETCTKDVLIHIIRTIAIFRLSERDIYVVKCHSMTETAMALMDSANADMKACNGDYRKHVKAMEEFNKAERLFKRAKRLHKVHVEKG